MFSIIHQRATRLVDAPSNAQLGVVLDLPQRRVCRVLGQHRSTQRKRLCGADDEEAPTDDIVALAKQYGRSG